MSRATLNRKPDPAAEMQGSSPAVGQVDVKQSGSAGLGNQASLELMRREKGQEQGDPGAVAREVYEALDGWNNVPRALGALSGHSGAFSQRVEAAFNGQYGKPLRVYLKDQLDGDDLVSAFALLRFEAPVGPVVDLARALIVSGVRDDAILSTLESLSLDRRQFVAREYGITFGEIGQGSLKADLKQAFTWKISKFVMNKALILLRRDLTKADELYLASVAVESGTETDQVVELIQEAWGKGPAEFDALVRQWDQVIRGEGFSPHGLMEAMSHEVTHEFGDSWSLLDAIFQEYKKYRKQAGATATPATSTEQRQWAEEELSLAAAWQTVEAANAWLGTTEKSVFWASGQIQKIWAERIRRAEKGGKPAELKKRQAAWEQERARLLQVVEGDMRKGGDEYRRVSLMLSDELSQTDQIYLAWREGNRAKVDELVKELWLQNKVDDFWVGARRGRSKDGTVIRPPFNPELAVRGGLAALLLQNRSTVERGALQLKVLLDRGQSEEHLKSAFELLKTPGLVQDLRLAVIKQYADKNLPNGSGMPVERFLAHIEQRYEGALAYHDFAELLNVGAKRQSLAGRAKAREEAATSGVADDIPVVRVAHFWWDKVSGEDTRERVKEQQQAVKFVAEAPEEHLQFLMEQTGAKTPDELAQKQYGTFKAALEDMTLVRQTIVEAGVTVLELTVQAALAAVTGGAALGVMAASIAATVGGMMARKAAYGSGYELLSNKNMEKVITSLVASMTGNLAGQGLKTIVRPEVWDNLGKWGDFTQSVLTSVAKDGTAELLVAKQLPSAEALAAAAFKQLSSAGISVHTDAWADALKKQSQLYRAAVVPTLAENLATGTTGVMADWAATGVSGKTGGAMAAELAGTGGEAFRSTLFSLPSKIRSLTKEKEPELGDTFGINARWAEEEAARREALAKAAAAPNPVPVAKPEPVAKPAPAQAPAPAPAPKAAPNRRPSRAQRKAANQKTAAKTAQPSRGTSKRQRRKAKAK